MEDRGSRTKALMYELEFTYLKRDWLERIVAGGVERRDGHVWIAEIGHVVDEYERSLRYLFWHREIGRPRETAEEVFGWASYTEDMTVWKLGDVCEALDGAYKNYLPPAGYVPSKKGNGAMDELKTRISALLEEIEYVHLKRDWTRRVIAEGTSAEDGLKCATELANIINEYKIHLFKTIDLLGTSEAHDAAQALEAWIAYTRDVAMRRISEALAAIMDCLEKYQPPPDPEEEDE
jgi:hypothetical protein